MAPWNAPKAKVQLRLGVQRLRTLQEKKAAQAKASRRDIAILLEKGKVETARIKAESIINEDIYIELLELLELYCELLLARFGLLDQNTPEPDPGVNEGVCAIIHAAPRTEIKELHVLREILMHKYGRDFSIAVMENKDSCVSERVTRKLVTHTPPSELVDAYLGEIARGYGVNWTPPNEPKDDHNESGGDGGVKEPEKTKALESPLLDAAAISVEARSSGMRTPKLPELPPTEETTKKAPSKEAVTPSPPAEDDFEALARRFAALKKR